MPVVSSRVSVLIAEDHAVVAEGIALVLAPYFTIAGQVRSLPQLIPEIQHCRPVVVVLDITFGSESSIPQMRRARELLRLKPEFVILTGHESRAMMDAAYMAGALGFVTKGSSGQNLRLAIEAAAAGRKYTSARMTPTSTPRVAASGVRQKVPVGEVSLTRRQLEVNMMVRAGVPRCEIAERLGITVKGVEYNVAAVKEITGIPRLVDLIRWLDEHAAELPV